MRIVCLKGSARSFPCGWFRGWLRVGWLGLEGPEPWGVNYQQNRGKGGLLCVCVCVFVFYFRVFRQVPAFGCVYICLMVFFGGVGRKPTNFAGSIF